MGGDEFVVREVLMGLVSRIAEKEAKEARRVRKKILEEKKGVQEGKYEEDFGRKRLWEKRTLEEKSLRSLRKIGRDILGIPKGLKEENEFSWGKKEDLNRENC